MSSGTLIAIEMFVVLALVLGLGFQQLWSLRRDRDRERRERDADPAARDDAAAPRSRPAGGSGDGSVDDDRGGR